MITSELKTRLEAQNLTTGYEVTRGFLPATPDKVIAIYETGGSASDVAFDGSVVQHPTVKFVVRGAEQDYDGPRLTIERILQAIESWGAFVVSNVRYLALIPLQPPFLQNRDAKLRCEWTFNATVDKEKSPTS